MGSRAMVVMCFGMMMQGSVFGAALVIFTVVAYNQETGIIFEDGGSLCTVFI